MGILPLRIETGRYVGEPVEQRHCRICNHSSIEDETHVLFECTLYNTIRQSQYQELFAEHNNETLNYRFVHIMLNYPRKLAKCLTQIIMIKKIL